MNDVVNHPAHYKSGGMEAIDVIEAFGLGFHLGNVVKYILRTGRKDAPLQELSKANWYLGREIERRRSMPIDEQYFDPTNLHHYSLCYLATPYTKYKPGLQAAFEGAAMIAAHLLKRGVKIYSPIVHCHPLAQYGGIDALDHSIWIPYDQAMMEAADCLVVARMPGWEESYGVTHEINWFSKVGKPVIHFDPVEMKVLGEVKP